MGDIQKHLSEFVSMAQEKETALKNQLIKMKAVVKFSKGLKKKNITYDQVKTITNQIRERISEMKREESKIEWEDEELERKTFAIEKAAKS